jgi:uncharacterized protein YoxC
MAYSFIVLVRVLFINFNKIQKKIDQHKYF